MSYLELADWRRAIARLYAEVRELAASDPAAAHAHWRVVRERLYRAHPQSPLPPHQRAGFHALHFPYDPALRFEVALVADAPASEAPSPAPGSGAVPIATSTSGVMPFRRVGSLEVPFPAGRYRLTLFWLQEYAGGFFLSFRDATSGSATYGGGRYLLDGAKSADLGGSAQDGTLVLDFNFAYHPSCAFDPRWICPLTAPENRLGFPINAGERLL